MSLIILNLRLHTIRFENGYTNKRTEWIISTFVRRRNVFCFYRSLLNTNYRFYTTIFIDVQTIRFVRKHLMQRSFPIFHAKYFTPKTYFHVSDIVNKVLAFFFHDLSSYR